ncbi:MAG: protein-glutamate O-methyltransferase CheR [bacterium]
MNDLELIVDKIKRDKGFDLSGYKESTLSRRIERRFQFDGASSTGEYIRMIDKDYHLYWRFISDFFIGVTDFFRDKEIWEIVMEKVLPEIIARRTSHVSRPTSHVAQLPLRIWSAGCSTGEETYSLAIMIREIYEKQSIKGLPAFVHGTDILEDKLEFAKRGFYTKEKTKGIENALLEKYFDQRDTNNEIRNTIKIMMRFKKLDLVCPEGYAGFDMIACRNVLIYFQRGLQEKVIKHFHKALRPNGILWLGKSETLWGETETLFEPVYKNEKIFRKM